MRERVSEQPLPAEHRKAPEHSAESAEDRRSDRDVPEGVVLDQVDEEAHRLRIAIWPP
jgi:hypothetical protein